MKLICFTKENVVNAFVINAFYSPYVVGFFWCFVLFGWVVGFFLGGSVFFNIVLFFILPSQCEFQAKYLSYSLPGFLRNWNNAVAIYQYDTTKKNSSRDGRVEGHATLSLYLY